MTTRARATIEDFYNVPEGCKGEIVNGELVIMSPTGGKPSRASGRIYASLLEYERDEKSGYAFPNNAAFVVDLPNRSSFSPDAAFYTGTVVDEDFLQGAPLFAAEIRSKGDYGAMADRRIASKISDYFKAGTLVVWDVDILREQVVRAYCARDPENPTLYRRGTVADAEPAVPGWRFLVHDLFE